MDATADEKMGGQSKPMLLRTKIALVATAILVSLSFILLVFGELQARWANEQFEFALLDGDSNAISTLHDLDSRFLARVSTDIRDMPQTRITFQSEGSTSADFILAVQERIRFLDPQPEVYLLSRSFTVLGATSETLPGNFAQALDPLLDGTTRTFNGLFYFPRTGSVLHMFVQEVRLRDTVAGYLITALDFAQRSRLLLRDRAAITFVGTSSSPRIMQGAIEQDFIDPLTCCNATDTVVRWRGNKKNYVSTVTRLLDPRDVQIGDLYIVRDQTKEVTRLILLNRLSYVGVSLFILMAVTVLIWSLRTSLRPLSAVVQVLRALSDGDTSTGLKTVSTSREIGDLANTVETFRTGQQARQQLLTLSEQISSASRIQQTILPREFDIDKSLDLHAKMTPAQDIGGDFFDIFRLDGDRVCILVADVAGKGIGSALFASNASAMLRANAPLAKSTSDLVALVNRELCKRNDEGLFITLFITIFDLKTGEVTFTNAGHGQPFLVNLDETIELLPMTGDMALGFFDDVDYSHETTHVKPGQTLILYTDGFDEAMSPTGVLLGMEDAQNIVKETAGLSAVEAIEIITNAIAKHEDGTPSADDITLIALRWDPTGTMNLSDDRDVFLDQHAPTTTSDKKVPEPAE